MKAQVGTHNTSLVGAFSWHCGASRSPVDSSSVGGCQTHECMIYNGQTRINQVSPAFKLIIRHLLGAISIICSGRERVKPKLPLLKRAAKFFFWLFSVSASGHAIVVSF